MFDDLVRIIKEGDILGKLYGYVGLKKLFSDSATAPYQEIIDVDLVPFVIESIKQQDYAFLQIEALCVLINMVGSNDFHYI
jgi:hypothetical protein